MPDGTKVGVNNNGKYKYIKPGDFVPDKYMRTRVTSSVSRAAKKAGIMDPVMNKTFSSHCFRGGFAIERAKSYCFLPNKQAMHDVINEKIKEQPRLKSKYDNFKDRISKKLKLHKREERAIEEGKMTKAEAYEALRERRKRRTSFDGITDKELVLFITSIDINHSRKEISSVYVPDELIEEFLQQGMLKNK